MPKSSFEPIENSEISILILGSIPGDRSIALQEYYGHPQNRFWKMLAHITGKPEPADYAEKKLCCCNRASACGMLPVPPTAKAAWTAPSGTKRPTT